MSLKQRNDFWGVVMNKTSQFTAEDLEVIDDSFSGTRAKNPQHDESGWLLPDPAEKRPAAKWSAVKRPPNQACSLPVPSALASNSLTRYKTCGQTISHNHPNARNYATALAERRAQKSGQRPKQMLLLQPPFFKRGHQSSIQNGELIRKWLASELPAMHTEITGNPHAYVRH